MNPDLLHFEAAINPYGCSPRVVEAIKSAAARRDYRSYGEADAITLREKLAAHHGLAPDSIVVYNGSGEALAWLFVLNLLIPRGRLILPSPSYERFVEAGRRCAAEVIEVPLNHQDFSLDVDRLIDEANQKQASVGLFSSPNNPTGNLLLNDVVLERILSEAPRCLWIVDEAYADYAGVNFVSRVNRHRNLVVLRTFSKVYGLAGLRVGFAAGHSETIRSLAQARLPWNVNSISLAAAEAAIMDQEYVTEIVTQIRSDCRQFEAALKSVSYLHVYPSAANFFLIELSGASAAVLQAYLASHQILVRGRPDMPQHVRITSLLPAQNQRLIAALAAFNPAGELAACRSPVRVVE